MSLLDGLIVKPVGTRNVNVSGDTFFAADAHFEGDTFFTGKIVVNTVPADDETVVLSMSNQAVNTDLSGYRRDIIKSGDVVEVVHDGMNYASMGTVGSFVRTDLGISGTQSFSVGFSLYFTGSPSGARVLSIGRTSIDVGDGFFAFELSGTKLTAHVSHYTTPTVFAAGGSMSVSVSASVRYNIVFTYDSVSRMMSIYVDNVLMNRLIKTDVAPPIWSIPEGKGILRAGADASGDTVVGLEIGQINVSWGRIWATEDIAGLTSKNWKPKVDMKETFAAKTNPVFKGTIDMSGGLVMPPLSDVSINAPRANDTTLVLSQDETVSIMTDASRYARVITKTSDVNQETDFVHNNVAVFSGVTSYIESDIAVVGVKSLCVAFWIYPSALPISNLISIGTYTNVDTVNGILKFSITAAGEIDFTVNGTTLTTSGVAIPAGAWTHIVITLSETSGILEVFKNSVGAYVSSALVVSTVPEGSGILRIGSTGPSDIMFINAGVPDVYSLATTTLTAGTETDGEAYLIVSTQGNSAISTYDMTFGEQWTILMEIDNIADSTYYSRGSDFWAYSAAEGLRVNIYGVVHTFDNGVVPQGRIQLTITYDSATSIRAMYLNGVLQSAIVLEATNMGTTGQLTIFGSITDGTSVPSKVGQKLYNMYVFNRVLTTEEMTAYLPPAAKLPNYPNAVNTTTETEWKLGHLNVAWGRVWTQTDIDGLYAPAEWFPRLTLAETFVTRSNPEFIALDQPLEETYATIANPVFTGVVALPEETTLANVSLTTTLAGKASLEDVNNAIAGNATKADSENPVFTGTVTATNTTSVLLPATSNVSYGGTPLSTTLGLKANSENPEFTGANGLKFNGVVVVNSSGNIASGITIAPTIQFGPASTPDNFTLRVPFRSPTNIGTTISIGTSYQALITVDGMQETLPTGAIVEFTFATANNTASGTNYFTPLSIPVGISLQTGDIYGSYLDVNGSSTFKTATSTSSYPTTTIAPSGTGFTMSFDIKWTVDGTGTAYYLTGIGENMSNVSSWVGSSTTEPAYGITLGRGNTTTFYIMYVNASGGLKNYYSFTAPSPLTDWNHYDIVIPTNTINPTIYINGNIINYNISPLNATSFILRNNINTRVHFAAEANDHYRIANFRTWLRPLTANELAEVRGSSIITPLIPQIYTRDPSYVDFKLMDRSFNFIDINAKKAQLAVQGTIIYNNKVACNAVIPTNIASV